MNSTSCERTKRRICKELSERRLSISHDRWHLDRVLGFAQQLQAIHGGDPEVITAAVLLHDLARSEPDLGARARSESSLEDAKKVLADVGLSSHKIDVVLLAIEEHDQPELSPSTVEGRILKEADSLAGFGAWGILRIAMWAAEGDRGVPQIFDRLEHRMPKRLKGLEFPESVRLAKREMLFADLFLSRLREPPLVEDCRTLGKYIVLEGISGSGKNSQADLLKPRLEEIGHTVVMVSEPAGKYQSARDHWGARGRDPVIQLFLMLADRYELVTERVKPALARGDAVVSVRSYVSTLVYQRQHLYDPASIRFMHHFVPPPDLVIVYDVDPGTAYARCAARSMGIAGDMGAHEQREALETHRQLYLEVIRELPMVDSAVIDASRSVDEVAAETWQVVEHRLL